MLTYIRNILGTYTPLQGEGIASVNWEWILGALILLFTLLTMFKSLLYLISMIFKK